MSSPNRSTKKRSVAEKGKVDNGTSAKKMREEEESKIPGIKQEETSEVPGMLKQETGEETDALKQETDDEMDALKHETDDEIEEEDDVNSPPLPPLPGAEASSGGSREARSHIGIANPNGNKYIARWNDRYFELIEYKEKYGNCNVPKKYEANKQLGKWVATQRQQYRLLNEGKKVKITRERIAKLNEIGFVWDGKCGAYEDAWGTRLAELIAYKAKHGDCLVPRNDEENKQLGEWVKEQRTQCRLLNEDKEAHITSGRIAKLNEIGFVWDTKEAAWETRFTQLVAYKEEHGNCNVPKKYEENKQLGTWVKRQRAEYQQLKKDKKAKITRERIAKLSGIGFKWRLK